MARLTGLVRGLATTSLAAARTEQLRRRIHDSARRAMKMAALILVGAALLAVGLAFLVAAAYMQLSDWLGPKGAALVLAVTMIVAGAGCWALVSASGEKSPTAKARAPSGTEALKAHLGDLGQAASALRQDVVRVAADKPELLVLGAFLIGLVSGRRRRGD